LRAGIDWDEEVRCVLFKGHEERGFDLEPSPDPPEGTVEPGSISNGIAQFEKPVIAFIEGHALGWGLEWALSADLRVASENSLFGLPQVSLGTLRWDGGTQRLSRLVGRGKSLELILTGESIDAKEALRIGLVNRIVAADQVMDVAMGLAGEMALKGPVAVRYAKEAIIKGMDMTLEQGLRLEADLYLLLHTTRDRTEGIKAFQEKRKPEFEGK